MALGPFACKSTPDNWAAGKSSRPRAERPIDSESPFNARVLPVRSQAIRAIPVSCDLDEGHL